MSELLTKDNLGIFTRAELLGLFPSLEISANALKGEIVEEILTGSPTDDEQSTFSSELKKKQDTISEAKTIVPKAKAKITFGAENDVEFDPNDEFVVEHSIKEDGKKYVKGDPYKGKKIGRFLNSGQIRKKDK